MGLKIHPELGLDPEVAAKAQGCVGRNTAFAMDDCMDAPGMNTDVLGL